MINKNHPAECPQKVVQTKPVNGVMTTTCMTCGVWLTKDEFSVEEQERRRLQSLTNEELLAEATSAGVTFGEEEEQISKSLLIDLIQQPQPEEVDELIDISTKE